ncbi:MAG: hypothetical protein ACRDHZ_02520 [Ktedonobacteraceae bacterium]
MYSEDVSPWSPIHRWATQGYQLRLFRLPAEWPGHNWKIAVTHTRDGGQQFDQLSDG